jgi:malonyl CoA-acyl carrier protein transacylase/thioesterase domain-containing protein/acyl carrier protein
MKRPTVQDKLADSFKKYPGNIALECGPRRVTYAELHDQSDAIANWILRNGIEKGSFIGIYIADRIELIRTILAVLKAGCVFVPLAHSFPLKRIEKMLCLTGTGLVISDSSVEFPVRIISLNNIDLDEADRSALEESLVPYHGEDIVYIEFKTGPSGELTAAAGKNKSLAHLIGWEIDTFGIAETSRISQTASPGDGQFLVEVFPALCSGAAVCIDADTPGGKKTGSHPVIFMFAGLGGQYVNMGAGLYRGEPLFREEVDRCFDILKSETGKDIKPLLYPPRSVETGGDALQSIDTAQLVIFIFEYALAILLMKLGITPQAVIGYSFGEYTAACLAGVFSLTEALKLIYSRGQLLKGLSPGAMLSVPLPKDQLQALLTEPDISIAIDNGPSCIVAGPVNSITRFEKKLKQEKLLTIDLKATRALHSPMMEPILNEFREKLQGLTGKIPQIPFISTVTGDWITGTVDPTYWVKQLRETSRFADGVKVLLKKENAIFVEVGPGSDLSALLRYHTGTRPDCRIINVVRNPNKKVPDQDFFFNALTHLENREISCDRLIRWIDENRIRLLHCYPHLFHLLNSGKLEPGYFKHLTHVLLYGDRVGPGDLKRWYAVFPQRIQLVNLYGAAEITRVKMYYNIRAADAEKENIPIGKPIKGSRAIILNKSMNICDRGITGDIYIRTPYLAAGYINDPQLTRQRFISNPFGGAPDDLIYKTGDTGRMLADGNIELTIGPGDQVKTYGSTVHFKGIQDNYKPPTNEIEGKLVDIWSKILKKEKIGIRDDFFEIGGHSLGIITLAAEIYKTFNIEMTVSQLYGMPRIEDISNHIIGKPAGTPAARDMELPYMVFNASQPRNIFLFPPKIAYGVEYKELAKLVKNYAFYAFNFIEDENIVETYVDIIKSIQAQGPYTLLGYSAGGNLAFEVAKGMEKAGCSLVDLIIMDSFSSREIEGLDIADQQDNYLEFVEKSLQSRGLSFMKDKILQKVKQYSSYLEGLRNTGTVKANIYFITAENRKILNDWEHLTINRFKIYKGFGNHIRMLDPGILEKNAVIISEILTKSLGSN